MKDFVEPSKKDLEEKKNKKDASGFSNKIKFSPDLLKQIKKEKKQ